MKKASTTRSLLVATLLVGTQLGLATLGAGCEPAVRPVDVGAAPASGALALTDDDTRLVIAAEDHDQLLVLDRATRAVLHRVDVPAAPTHVILDDKARAIVSSRYGHAISVVDIATGTVVRRIPVGVEPIGLALTAPGVVAVALAGEQALAVVDLEAGRVIDRIALPDADPRAVALLPDGTLYVSHMATGALSRVDLAAHTARRVDVTTPNAFGPRIVAEHLRSLTVDADSGDVVMAHSQANIDTVRAPIGGGGDFVDGAPRDAPPGEPPSDVPGDMPIDGSGCGYSGCPSELGAVVPAVTEVDSGNDVVKVPVADPTTTTTCDGCEAAPMADVAMMPMTSVAPPSVLNPGETRFIGIPMANPSAVALVDGGRAQLVIHLGTHNAVLLRRHLKGTSDDVIATAPLGDGSSSIALTHDGATALVWNQFDASITELTIPALHDNSTDQTRFADDTTKEATLPRDPQGLVPVLANRTWRVVEDALSPGASAGRKLFHDATDTRVAAGSAISCASCHPDGRADGRTWQFVFGPRNTPQLGGDILDTAPFHWPGDVPTVSDLNTMTVQPFMGGTGLPVDDFGLITEYLHVLRAAPSVVAAVGTLNDSQQRGKAIFESASTGCTSCHDGAHFTDNVSYDIGTQASPSDIRAFQTPVLHGVSRSAPYFHDGRYPNLEAVVRGSVLTNQMGTGSHLTDADVKDLVAYLMTL